jgi:predicted Zn-dependent protease
VLALCVSISACTTPTVDGTAPDFDPTALTAGAIYHWPVGRSLGVHVVSGPGEGSLDAVARSAVSRWTSALAYREHTLRIVTAAADADIIIRDRSAPIPVDTTGCGGAGGAESIGRTLFCIVGDSARTLPLTGGLAGRTKVLITIDVAATTDASELLSLTVHELGHALGIGGHSASPVDVMYLAPVVTLPSAADARTLRYVLHRRPNLTL